MALVQRYEYQISSQSFDERIKRLSGSINNITGSGTATNTGSLLLTASFSNPNLTFIKGDGSTFNVNLVTLVPNTASYALTASFANEISGGAPNYVVLWKTSTSLTSSAFYQTGSFMGLGTTTPKVKFHVKDNNFGTMGLPYETAVFETNGDTKLGVYNSNTSSFTSQGVSLTLGYTSITNSLGYYPGFEIQELGNTTWYENYLRFNSIHRNISGTVLQAVQGIVNMFADGRVSINPVATGLTATSSFLIGTSTYGGFRFDSSGSSRFQTGLTVTGSLNAPTITGSLFGTSSWAISSSQAISSSYALSASFAPAGNPFPFTGSAQITGSLGVTGSVSLRSGSNLTVNNGLISASYGTNNVSVGGTPGWTTALRNTAVGVSTQGLVTTQTDNTSVGYFSLRGGTQNTAVGTYAAYLNIGTGNVAVGYEALSQETSNTSYNVAIGYQAMAQSSGSGNLYNIGIGTLALNRTRGENNIGIGRNAGSSNTTGNNNTFLGWYAGAYNTTGAGNIAIGYASGWHLVGGGENILLGTEAGGNNPGTGNTMGGGNVGIGYQALFAISSSVGLVPSNVAIGYQAGRNITTGQKNVALGNRAGLGLARGSNNIYIGEDTGLTTSTITLNNNIGIGTLALSSNVSGSRNTAVGYQALANVGATASAANDGGENTALGYIAGSIAKTGVRNTFIGYGSGRSNGGNPISNGSYNTFIGAESGVIQGNSGDWGNYGVAVGYAAMGYDNSGIVPEVPGDGNTALGSFTLARISSSVSTRNTSAGYRANQIMLVGGNNTTIGAYSFQNFVTGSYNIMIGDAAGAGIVSGSNNTIIGSITGLTASLNDTLIIGTGTTQRIRINSNGVGFVSGSLSIGNITSTSSTENTLTLYPPLAGGTGEGGQILLAASGGLYTSASMIDNYQNQIRILKGTNTGGSTTGYFTMNLDTGASQFLGPVTASAYSGLPNDYLYATRSGSAQTVGSAWANTDIVFNNNVVSKGISYNTGTGIASLTGGKVYRITARLAWGAAAAYNLQFSCYDSSNNQIGPTVEIIQSTNGTNNISDGTLEFIYAPGSNIDIKIRCTNNNTALSGETVRADLNTQFIIQQIA
jgi:hypothetical protein